MKLYYISEQSDPGKINLDDLLNRYRNYDFHFYTEYLSEEGIFTYEKNVLYREQTKDDSIQTKKIGDYEIIIDNSSHYREQWFQLPSVHKKETIYKYAFPFKNFQFAVECIRIGDKCIPVNTYIEMKDANMLNIQDTSDSLNEFLSTLK